MYTIGYSAFADSIPSVKLRTNALIKLAEERGDIRLIARDNDMDDNRAKANADEFASVPVDLAIIFHVNERMGSQLGMMFRLKKIPVIAIDIPIPMAYYFGVNNVAAGKLTGGALGEWVVANWDGQVDKVLLMTEQRVTGVLQERVQSALDSFLKYVDVAKKDVLYMDSGHSRDATTQRTISTLESWQEHEKIAIIGINDDVALGAIAGARQLGREGHVVVVGQDADPEAQVEILNPASRFIASTNVNLEEYAPRILDMAVRVLNGGRVDMQEYVPLSLFEAD